MFAYMVLTIDTVSMFLFFLKSPKHNRLLVEVVTKNVIEMGRKHLIDLCHSLDRKTSAFQHFCQCCKVTVVAFEVIGLGLHGSDFSDNFVFIPGGQTINCIAGVHLWTLGGISNSLYFISFSPTWLELR